MPSTQLTINSLINLFLPAAAPESFQDPQVKAAVDLMLTGFNNILRGLEQYTGATQKDVTLWNSLVPGDTIISGQHRRLYGIANEALAFGDFINLVNVAGVLQFRKSNGAAGVVKPAHGFCITIGGIAIGNFGEVTLKSGLLAVTGLLPGQAIYQSATPGLAGTVALVGAGQLEQFIGIGVASNLAYIDISMGSYIQH